MDFGDEARDVFVWRDARATKDRMSILFIAHTLQPEATPAERLRLQLRKVADGEWALSMQDATDNDLLSHEKDLNFMLQITFRSLLATCTSALDSWDQKAGTEGYAHAVLGALKSGDHCRFLLHREVQHPRRRWTCCCSGDTDPGSRVSALLEPQNCNEAYAQDVEAAAKEKQTAAESVSSTRQAAREARNIVVRRALGRHAAAIDSRSVEQRDLRRGSR
jgi:hypothetical protein